jgi:hypothetical protein
VYARGAWLLGLCGRPFFPTLGPGSGSGGFAPTPTSRFRFGDTVFDYVLSHEGIEHFREPERFRAGMRARSEAGAVW